MSIDSNIKDKDGIKTHFISLENFIEIVMSTNNDTILIQNLVNILNEVSDIYNHFNRIISPKVKGIIEVTFFPILIVPPLTLIGMNLLMNGITNINNDNAYNSYNSRAVFENTKNSIKNTILPLLFSSHHSLFFPSANKHKIKEENKQEEPLYK